MEDGQDSGYRFGGMLGKLVHSSGMNNTAEGTTGQPMRIQPRCNIGVSVKRVASQMYMSTSENLGWGTVALGYKAQDFTRPNIGNAARRATMM